jgi:radical SAM superfamily enzyme YgiQ (UPF0313 family)
MRVSLVSSVNLSSWYEQEREPADSSPPLGLLALAASLEQHGHTPLLYDVNHELAERHIAADASFYPAVASRILDQSPDLVGFSSLCSSYHIALRLAEAVKRASPSTPVVFGGPQASVVDELTLANFPWVDFILRGEADHTIPAFLDELNARAARFSTPGLTWRDSGGIRRNPSAPLIGDLDTLPLPAYHLLPEAASRAAVIDAGRGCPFGCTFCSTSLYWARRHRLKSIDRLLQEASELNRLYGASCFNFLHDLFTLDRNRLRRFCHRLIGEKRSWRWSCSARVDCLDAELLQLMAESGCEGIFFGVETGSPRMQKVIRKNLNLENALPVIDAARAAGIGPTVSFIAGFPDETEDDLALTFSLIEQLLRRPRVIVQLHLLGPEADTLEFAAHRGDMMWDGYYSDITGTSYRLLETEWFRRWPEMFASYHYYASCAIPRSLLRGVDLFAHTACAFLRRTVNALTASGRSLWQLYRDWHAWAESRNAGQGPLERQLMDEYLLDFCAFVEEEAAAGRANVDPGIARDEMLAYYIQNFGATPVRFGVR